MDNVSRRNVIGTVPLMALAAASRGLDRSQISAMALRDLEQKSGGTLGVCILDAHSGRYFGNRINERFGMCSSFKLPLAIVALHEADHGRLRLDEVIHYAKSDLMRHAPFAEKNLSKGSMTIEEMAQAAQEQSDNTATNLLLKRLGGPITLTSHLRRLGDPTTRLDHFEPEMNMVQPGEAHDTTTPVATARFLCQALTGSMLKPATRDKLIGWMIATQTGVDRLRAGLPKSWRAGDKTGSWWGEGAPNRVNDVAIFWPPNRAPIIVTSYYMPAVQADNIRDQDQAILADVGRIAALWATM